MRARVLANDGGPLVAIDAGDAALWKGRIEFDEDSDYGRACNTGYPAGLVPLGTSKAVVIGAREGIGTAGWLPSIGGQLLLVGCVFADQDAYEALPHLLNEADRQWAPLGTITLGAGRMLLFHATCRLSDLKIDPDGEVACIGDALSATVDPGQYALAASEVAVADKALFNVVRWTPA